MDEDDEDDTEEHPATSPTHSSSSNTNEEGSDSENKSDNSNPASLHQDTSKLPSPAAGVGSSLPPEGSEGTRVYQRRRREAGLPERYRS